MSRKVRSRALYIFATVLVVGSVVAAALVSQSSNGHRSGFTYKVYGTGSDREPDYVGLTKAEAQSIAPKFGETVRFLSAPSPRRAGTVVSQGLGIPVVYLMVSTGPLKNPEMNLVGTHGPPIASECDAVVSFTQDGNVYPITCGKTHVDVEAWNFYAWLLDDMHLGGAASRCQVLAWEERVFNGRQGATAPEIGNTAELAGVYFGWGPSNMSIPLVTNPPKWISSCGPAVVKAYTG